MIRVFKIKQDEAAVLIEKFKSMKDFKTWLYQWEAYVIEISPREIVPYRKTTVEEAMEIFKNRKAIWIKPDSDNEYAIDIRKACFCR
jgi:hypothetical protein